MQRATLGITGAVIASVALMWALRAQERQAAAPSGDTPTQAAPQERVAFTFSDEAQMQQFAQVWQQRQAIVMRMAVLQAYWNNEQATLGEVNQQLLAQYNLDVTKNYTLDTQRKILIDQPASPDQPLPLGGQALSPPQPASDSQPSLQSSAATPANP